MVLASATKLAFRRGGVSAGEILSEPPIGSESREKRRRVLVLVLDAGSERHLHAFLRERARVAVVIIVPAQIGPLAWLTSDEDEAWARARERAEMLRYTHPAIVDAKAGEADPIVAVDDETRVSVYEELVVLSDPAAHVGLERTLHQRFGLPTSRLPTTAVSRGPRRVPAVVRALASGRSAATPFVAFTAVNLLLLALAALLSALVLVLLWLF